MSRAVLTTEVHQFVELQHLTWGGHGGVGWRRADVWMRRHQASAEHGVAARQGRGPSCGA